MEKKLWVDYKCSWCGMTQTKSVNSGRPAPGNCPRKPKFKDGKYKPHTWVINKKY